MAIALVAETAGIRMACRSCGLAWTVEPKAGGSMPKGSRCPVSRGGCGTFHALPRAGRRGPGAPAGVAAAGGWEPSTAARKPCLTGEPCPDCGEPLLAGRRGTWRACPRCRKGVTPAAVAAPYARGERAAQRQVVSQRERDLAALELAQRKGVMLAQLATLADDDRLAAESVPVVEWFRDEVKAAKAGARLAELAELLPQAGIRRRRWWQSTPAVEAAAWDEDGDDEDDYDQDDDDQAAGGADRPRAIEAAPPPRLERLTWAEAMDVCGWQLTPTVGGCQVVEAGRLCGGETRHQVEGRHVRHAWVCDPHYYALGKVITDSGRRA